MLVRDASSKMAVRLSSHLEHYQMEYAKKFADFSTT